MPREALNVRRANEADLPRILQLCSAALGWHPDAPNERLFRWKHFENPFGRSAMWVAEQGHELIGFRAMMHWQFRRPDGSLISAVRAVDTATHPAHLRHGVFTELTRVAVDALTAEGVGFVFNTPNAASLPGYLKLGWVDAGRLQIVARPKGFGGLLRMLSANRPADNWAPVAKTETSGTTSNVCIPLPQKRSAKYVTSVDAAWGAWRFRAAPIDYRAMVCGQAGLTYRARRRGGAVELAIPQAWGTDEAVKDLIARAMRDTHCSYALATRGTPGCARMLPVTFLGPRLTLRSLAQPAPSAGEFAFALGDIELF